MNDKTKYGLKVEHLFCEECETELGYIVYQRWIDYAYCLCNLCMENRLKKGTYIEDKEIRSGEKE